MKRLYLKGLEDGQEFFVEVVIKNSIAKIEVITRSAPGSPWTIRPSKVFDLNDGDKKREYNNFKERFFESDRLEFESVKKQMTKPLTVSDKKQEDTLVSPKEILKKIKKFKGNRRKKK